MARKTPGGANQAGRIPVFAGRILILPAPAAHGGSSMAAVGQFLASAGGHALLLTSVVCTLPMRHW